MIYAILPDHWVIPQKYLVEIKLCNFISIKQRKKHICAIWTNDNIWAHMTNINSCSWQLVHLVARFRSSYKLVLLRYSIDMYGVHGPVSAYDWPHLQAITGINLFELSKTTQSCTINSQSYMSKFSIPI